MKSLEKKAEKRLIHLVGYYERKLVWNDINVKVSERDELRKNRNEAKEIPPTTFW